MLLRGCCEAAGEECCKECCHVALFAATHRVQTSKRRLPQTKELRGSEYDDTTWSARSWTSYTAQRISCVLARAVAWELATAMQLTRVRDARDD